MTTVLRSRFFYNCESELSQYYGRQNTKHESRLLWQVELTFVFQISKILFCIFRKRISNIWKNNYKLFWIPVIVKNFFPNIQRNYTSQITVSDTISEHIIRISKTNVFLDIRNSFFWISKINILDLQNKMFVLNYFGYPNYYYGYPKYWFGLTIADIWKINNLLATVVSILVLQPSDFHGNHFSWYTAENL